MSLSYMFKLHLIDSNRQMTFSMNDYYQAYNPLILIAQKYE